MCWSDPDCGQKSDLFNKARNGAKSLYPAIGLIEKN